MGSELSGDCPPCSTSSFGGETDMMYMPAAGMCYWNSLAVPSKTDAADHVTVDPDGNGLCKTCAGVQPPRPPARRNRALPRPDQLSARPTSGKGQVRSPSSNGRIPQTLMGLGLFEQRTGGDAMLDENSQPRESCCATAFQPLQHERYAATGGKVQSLVCRD